MTKRNLVLTSAIAALVSAGFAANSVSAYADEPAAAPTDAAAEKHECKSHKKGKNCDCSKKGCDGKKCSAKDGCSAKKDKDSCKGKKAAKDGCDGKDGCHGAPEAAKPAEAK